MNLTVTGVETIEITDPQGLIEAEKTDPLEALKATIQPRPFIPGIGHPTGGDPEPRPLPSRKLPGPWTTPPDPLGPRPYIGDPLINPILLPGHTPAEPKRVPWAQWTHLTGDGDRWSCGLHGHVLGARKSATEQVF